MIEWIEFKNFKALRDAKLPLSRFTLIVGPNGCGKSSALQGIIALRSGSRLSLAQLRTAGTPDNQLVSLTARWSQERNNFDVTFGWNANNPFGSGPSIEPVFQNDLRDAAKPLDALNRSRFFSLEANAIAQHFSIGIDCLAHELRHIHGRRLGGG